MPPLSFAPPRAVRSAAAEGLRLREKFGFGGTAVGVARARDLSNGRPVSLETIGRMVAYFARHGAQKPTNPGTKADPTPWLVAWLLWGGEPGRAWSAAKWRRHGPDAATADAFQRRPGQVQAYRAQALAAEPRPYREPMFAVPPGCEVARPLRVLNCGQVRQPETGDARGPDYTEAMLHEMARVVVERWQEDPVIIDHNHGSLFAPMDPDAAAALGRVVGAWVEDEADGRGPGLFVIPAYNARGRAIVAANEGNLWTSPVVVPGPVYDRIGAEPTKIADCLLLSLALTNSPAQVNSLLDLVSLSRPGAAPFNAGALPGGEPMTPEEMAAALEAAKAKIAELEAAKAAVEAKLAEYEAGMEGETDAEASAAPAAVPPPAADAMSANIKATLDALSARVEKAEKEAAQAKDEAQAEKWLADGRIAPVERADFIEALSERRAGREKWFLSQFGKRAPGSAVPLSAVGHGAKVEPPKDERAAREAERDRVQAYADQHKLSFVEAYKRLAIESKGGVK